ncbi:MAG: hypothetical protein RLZZ127_1688 [Planctomycetota bacterium]
MGGGDAVADQLKIRGLVGAGGILVPVLGQESIQGDLRFGPDQEPPALGGDAGVLGPGLVQFDAGPVLGRIRVGDGAQDVGMGWELAGSFGHLARGMPGADPIKGGVALDRRRVVADSEPEGDQRVGGDIQQDGRQAQVLGDGHVLP